MKNILLNGLPFEVDGIDVDDLQVLEETYQALKTKFNITLQGNVNLHINKFELFNNNPKSSIGGTLILDAPTNNCYLTFIKTDYALSAGGRGGASQTANYSKYQVWGVVNLSNDFGRVLIRKKTFADKMMGLFQSVSLKFTDDQEFSSRFYVVANDIAKAGKAMTPAFRKVILPMLKDDQVIEIVNNTLIIGDGGPINPEKSLQIAEFVERLAAVA
ncbi:hypothetical protein [Mucilaginibacter sp. dw_454]|uniref:hypothetical protein n=1 Tax=Mucilaginibacter sp. dw_454 TaxID=2720079 RepID=UPI001BD2131E|nr:hypothetical protein [Mucilaginibacter sp. dw_454]